MTSIREVMRVWVEQYDFFLWQSRKKVGVEKARDLLHEVIVYATPSLAKSYDKSRGTSLQTYMQSRFKYLMIDQTRKETGYRRKERFFIQEFDIGEEDAIPARINESLFPNIDMERFEWCLDQIPARSRDAVQKYVEGWSLKEIGETQSVKTSTISCRLSDAKNRIKKLYKKKSEDTHGD